jgi:hypothetical protein
MVLRWYGTIRDESPIEISIKAILQFGQNPPVKLPHALPFTKLATEVP